MRQQGFTDGDEYGFGGEIGISTQKLHARGPMGIKRTDDDKIHNKREQNQKIIKQKIKYEIIVTRSGKQEK